MRFRDEILQGLRLGVILLAAVLTGLASYRYLRDRPAAEIKQSRKPDPVLANTPPFVVPAPPPPGGSSSGHPQVRRHVSTHAVAQDMTVPESKLEAETISDADVLSADQERRAGCDGRKIRCRHTRPRRRGRRQTKPREPRQTMAKGRRPLFPFRSQERFTIASCAAALDRLLEQRRGRSHLHRWKSASALGLEHAIVCGSDRLINRFTPNLKAAPSEQNRGSAHEAELEIP